MKIGVVVAMNDELQPILGKLEYTETVVFGKTVYHTHIGENEGFILRSGVGEIASSAATQFLIVACGVEAVLNVGLAGSLSPDLKVGDTVLVTGVVHYDFDTSALDGIPCGKYSEFDSVVVPCDVELARKMLDCAGRMKTAIVASGDKFVADSKFKARLVSEFGAGLAEMESAGVALTATRNGIPAVIIKIVSDNADENAVVDFGAMIESNAGVIADFLS